MPYDDNYWHNYKLGGGSPPATDPPYMPPQPVNRPPTDLAGRGGLLGPPVPSPGYNVPPTVKPPQIIGPPDPSPGPQMIGPPQQIGNLMDQLGPYLSRIGIGYPMGSKGLGGKL